MPQTEILFGRAELLKEGDDFTLVALGSMVDPSLEAVELLAKEGLSGTVINARFAKPLDIPLLKKIGSKSKFIFTVEEGIVDNGFGSMVAQVIEKPVNRIGLPCDFIAHGKREILLEKYGLSAQGIAKKIKSIICPK